MPPESRPLLVLHLAGSQAEMGAQHGSLLREVGGYEKVLAYYPRMPEILIGPLTPCCVRFVLS